ncbi:MAG: TrmB family transcriptional regulator [Halococcoides sp.]
MAVVDIESLTTVLEDAGLSQYQAEAYVTVLELGSATATAVANNSSVPDPRIYDVLRDLEQQGYVETYQQESLRVRAFSPESVLADLRERAAQFEAAAEEIERRWEQPSIDSHSVNFVKREQTVLEHAETAIEAADCQVMLAANADQVGHLEDALRDALDRGVYVMIVLYSADGAPLRERIDPVGLASTVRVRPDPTPFLTLVDRTVTCFAPHDMSMNRFGIIVDDPSHAFVFRWFYTIAIWESANTVYERNPGDVVRVCVNFPRCVGELEPLLDDGAQIRATVHAAHTKTEKPVRLSGRIDSVSPARRTPDREDVSKRRGSGPTLDIEVDGETHAVGDWGAIVEPYEAMRVEIESIDWR